MPELSLYARVAPLLDFRLGRFAAVGVSNTCIGLSVIFACKAWLGLGDVAANAAGYGIAVLLGFMLNRQWTFAHTGHRARAFVRYLIVLAFAYAANLAATLCAIDVLHFDSYLAQAAGIVPYALAGYLGARLFAFRSAPSGR
jgi:putative flippase GtrA